VASAGRTPAPPTSKYGNALSASDWHGPELRRGDWPERGKLEDLAAGCDSLLVWTGNAHEVTLHGQTPGAPTTSTTFVRHAGMIDIMPAGTR
jgi:hypothetical protein